MSYWKFTKEKRVHCRDEIRANSKRGWMCGAVKVDIDLDSATTHRWEFIITIVPDAFGGCCAQHSKPDEAVTYENFMGKIIL